MIKLRAVALRYTLFGWPPVASHLTVFLLGLGLAQLPGTRSADAAAAQRAGPARSAVLSLPENVNTPQGSAPLRPGDEVALARESSDNRSRCVIATPLLRLETRVPRFALRFNVTQSSALSSLGRALQDEHLLLVRRDVAASWTACGRKAKIVYGSP